MRFNVLQFNYDWRKQTYNKQAVVDIFNNTIKFTK
jgi:hypothetical protein